ncbi:hypothetical protein C2845_PM07G04510 [Panicum miliaceum]|uniref:Uncharacterized protein n=1 Tax=Panicum miliaceum TaxID=4540 RepID=A0A3L6SM90_PANMI|nr:hypothetical protein C2845_PM07G04510 [Panicum miliaceum]
MVADEPRSAIPKRRHSSSATGGPSLASRALQPPEAIGAELEAGGEHPVPGRRTEDGEGARRCSGRIWALRTPARGPFAAPARGGGGGTGGATAAVPAAARAAMPSSPACRRATEEGRLHARGPACRPLAAAPLDARDRSAAGLARQAQIRRLAREGGGELLQERTERGPEVPLRPGEAFAGVLWRGPEVPLRAQAAAAADLAPLCFSLAPPASSHGGGRREPRRGGCGGRGGREGRQLGERGWGRERGAAARGERPALGGERERM